MKAQGYRGHLTFLLSLEQPQTLMVLAPAFLPEQNSSSCPHPASFGPSVPGSPLPLGCGTSLCPVPSSSPSPWGTDSPCCHVSLMTSTQSARP